MKALKVFLAFMLMMIIGFFAIGFSSSVPAPVTGSAAYNQSVNLTKAIDISSTGVYAIMLILIVVMVLSAIIFMASNLKRRR